MHECLIPREDAHIHGKLPTGSSMNASHILLHVVPAFWIIIIAAHQSTIATANGIETATEAQKMLSVAVVVVL
jgi:hypothetical protein